MRDSSAMAKRPGDLLGAPRPRARLGRDRRCAARCNLPLPRREKLLNPRRYIDLLLRRRHRGETPFGRYRGEYGVALGGGGLLPGCGCRGSHRV
jgi:hypothetical protein